YLAINRRINHNGFIRLDRKEWIYSEKQIPELVIVSQHTWEKAQEIREARKNRINASKKISAKEYEAQYNVPFSTNGKLALIGLAACGYCGKRLKNGSYCNHWTTKSGEKKVSYAGRYVCPAKCEERSCYPQNYLEGIVFGVVEIYLEHLKSIDITEEIKKMQSQQRQSAEKELEAIHKRQRTLKMDIRTLEEKIPEAIRGEYYFSAEKLSAMIKEKNREEEELYNRAEQIRNRLLQAADQDYDMEKFVTRLPNWKEEFQNADTQTKRMLLSCLIDKVEVRDNDINIKFRLHPGDWTLPESIDIPTTPYKPGLA
ncbi:MAG: hypothetical protein K2O40_12165, partial [Lachnospiraceae bacterium]|nr:hypothetical protein [Lachnospiraceae bacterium]